MKKRIQLLILMLGLTLPLPAQQLFQEWAAGKKGAVYLSRKQFNYTQDWLQFLNQFTLSGGNDIPREDLKLATLVRLGQLMQREFQEKLQTQSLAFLNESPELSSAWLALINLKPGEPLPAQTSGLDTLDFIISVESLNLHAVPEKSVYSVSNQIRTDKRWVYYLEAKLRISDGRNRTVSKPVDLIVRSEGDTSLKPVLNFDNEISPGGRLFAELFSGVLKVKIH